MVGKAAAFAEVIEEYLDEVDRENLRDNMSNAEMAYALAAELVERGLISPSGG
jgi:cation transport regulator ChaB